VVWCTSKEVQVVAGEITYIDQDHSRPMRLRQLDVRGGSIRAGIENTRMPP
jgi:hypothetical protein